MQHPFGLYDQTELPPLEYVASHLHRIRYIYRVSQYITYCSLTMGFATHSELERGFLADCDELGLSVSEDDLPMLMPALSFPFVFSLSFVALYAV